MYVIPPYEAGVTLHRLDGTSEFFPTRHLLLKKVGLRALRYGLGPQLDPSCGWNIVILDEHRNPLFARDFQHLAGYKPALSHFYRISQALSFWNGTGPVPFTGRRSGYRVYRSNLHTAQERRANAFFDAEAGEPRPRARRVGQNLPSDRDDVQRTSYRDRGWKRHRKHQWKE